ncbi:MAG TPA: YvcK family protein [Bacillota bacterium]|nr:YvcK family protein [Bacillota bacterium]
MRWMKWLYPGLRIKRWIFLACMGLIFTVLGFGLLFYRQALFVARFVFGLGSAQIVGAGVVAIVLGALAILYGLNRAFRSTMHLLMPPQREKLIDVMFEKTILDSGPNVVVIGGGTGLSSLLRGLKVYTSNITAVVTVTDDGGSSGKLREGMGILPPGDIRNCVLALADTEPLMEQLFQYRFSEAGLSGHSFGNLLIAAMSEVTGDFQAAVKEFSKVLAVRGTVLPVTLTDVSIRADLTDGRKIYGESQISAARGAIRQLYLEPPEANALPEVIEAISCADVVVIGPGSLFTSIIPNLLVGGVARALAETPATRIYICNVMTQPGETTGFGALQHVTELEKYMHGKVADVIIVNSEKVHPDLEQRYRDDGASPVTADVAALRERGYKVISGALLRQDDTVRHDPGRLARAVMRLVVKNTIDARMKGTAGKLLADSRLDLIDEDSETN